MLNSELYPGHCKIYIVTLSFTLPILHCDTFLYIAHFTLQNFLGHSKLHCDTFLDIAHFALQHLPVHRPFYVATLSCTWSTLSFASHIIYSMLNSVNAETLSTAQ